MASPKTLAGQGLNCDLPDPRAQAILPLRSVTPGTWGHSPGPPPLTGRSGGTFQPERWKLQSSLQLIYAPAVTPRTPGSRLP